MQQILLHYGVPDCVTPPRDLRSDHRVAVIFQPLAGSDELSIDEELFFDVIEGLGGLIAHDSVAVVDGIKTRGSSLLAERDRYFAAPEEDREFSERLDLYLNEARAASFVIEEWALVGGPDPYHDSYTLAVYTPVNMDNRISSTVRSIASSGRATVMEHV